MKYVCGHELTEDGECREDLCPLCRQTIARKLAYGVGDLDTRP